MGTTVAGYIVLLSCYNQVYELAALLQTDVTTLNDHKYIAHHSSPCRVQHTFLHLHLDLLQAATRELSIHRNPHFIALLVEISSYLRLFLTLFWCCCFWCACLQKACKGVHLNGALAPKCLQVWQGTWGVQSRDRNAFWGPQARNWRLRGGYFVQSPVNPSKYPIICELSKFHAFFFLHLIHLVSKLQKKCIGKAAR